MGAFIPGIGELVISPVAVLAVVLGLVGVQRYETRQAAGVVPAVVGAVLGLLALMVTMLVLVATHVSP